MDKGFAPHMHHTLRKVQDVLGRGIKLGVHFDDTEVHLVVTAPRGCRTLPFPRDLGEHWSHTLLCLIADELRGWLAAIDREAADVVASLERELAEARAREARGPAEVRALPARRGSAS